MTVYVAEAHAHLQKLVSVVKMVTVLEECTAEEQRSVVRYFAGNTTQCKSVHNEVFPAYCGKCLS
jgi:hypothetical protein